MVNRLGVSLCFAERSSGKKDHLYKSQDKVTEKAAKEVLAAMQTDNVSEAREIFDKYAQSVTSQASMPGSVLTINELIKPLLNLPGTKASQVFNKFTFKLCKMLEIKGSESIIDEDLRARYLIQQYLDEEEYEILCEYVSQNRDRIKDESILIEAAKKMAQRSENVVSGSSILSARIAEFRITDEQALIEIAKIAAAHDEGEISLYIEYYGITNQQALIEIAKIAAAKDAWSVFKYIQRYGIKDQQALIEIAKLAAAQSGANVSNLIKNYGITDQQGLVEIAKIATAEDALGTSLCIQNYGITDQQGLVEVAKIAVVLHGEVISYFIQNYGITDQQGLVGIAKLAASQNGSVTSMFIQKFGIKDEKALIEIANIAAIHGHKEIAPYIQNYGISDQQAIAKIKQKATAQLEPRDIFDICFEVAGAELNAFSGEQQQKLEEIQKSSVKNVSAQVFKEKLRLFLILVTRLKLQGKTPEQLDAVLKTLERIMQTRSHPLSLKLSHHLMKLTHDVERFDTYRNVISGKNRACFLPMLVLSALKGENLEVYKTWAQKLSADRDGPRGKARLNAILSLVKNCGLPQEGKKELVNWVIKEDPTPKKHNESKQLLKNFQLIEQLLELHQEEQIRQALKDFTDRPKEYFFKHLTKIRNKAMSKLLGVEMTNFTLEKLEAFFGKFRQPTALFRYATRLAGLHHVETTQSLGGYVQSVVEGNFKKVRYSLEKNLHLATIAQTCSDVFEKWQLGSKTMLDSSSAQKQPGKYILEDTDDPCDLLLLGTEVKGSCQSVDASADTNRGLLSYLLDGKNRAIVIKDSQGVIQARCVIRLLWDPVSSRPVLFQERIYPYSSSLPQAWVKALERGCLQKAQDLGLDLLSLDGKEPYQGKVVSLGGPVPFEYVDAVGGLKEGGKFEIKNAKRVELLEEKTEKIEA